MEKKKFERETVSVYVGTIKKPLLVTRASTGYSGIAKGDTKGQIFLEVILTESQIRDVEELPEIAEMITAKKEEIEALNAPILAQISSVPESVAEELKKQLHKWVDWYQPVLNKDKGWEHETNENGEKLFIAKFKQKSIKKQIDENASSIIYVTHFKVNKENRKITKIIDREKRPIPLTVLGGAEVAIRINTKIIKYPSKNWWGLTTSRLMEIYHVKEGVAGTGAVKAVNELDVGGEGFEIEELIETGRIDRATSESSTDNSVGTTSTSSMTTETTSVESNSTGSSSSMSSMSDDSPY